MTHFWFENISILYDKKYLLEILPKKEYDLNRKLNALLRFTIYYCLIIFITDNSKVNILFFILAMAVFTYFIFNKYKESYINTINNELMNNTSNVDINDLSGTCRIPNKDNPFMNPPLGDYNTTDSLPSCSSYNNKGVQIKVEKEFDEDLYKDVNDIFGKGNSQRQFYTVPGNDVPNDRDTFMKWLYQTPPTCKEGNGLQCAANQSGF
jgi:hypothetical protein